ncbi:polyunsaturated fatty acid 5-lipoxygenase-like [Chiloscyllium plagiosum]|uniref:polyunsaturated fatty acid 5-lipoxygenase-like n=1 Tax=Chiloscyllium plagiosum TaxID=36176 RepID=UPI001CB850B1|nr:polyunsaturated fatty acid 5-lipoxygenase-like [Chiloscyllium plagiosum]
MNAYKVTIETGTIGGAGTQSYVYCTLIGEKGVSHKASVNRWLHCDLKQGSVGHDEIASNRDLGTIYFVELQVIPFIGQDCWFCCCAMVEIPEGNLFHFPCYKWLADNNIDLREGTAKRFHDDSMVSQLQLHRQAELWEKQLHCRFAEVGLKEIVKNLEHPWTSVEHFDHIFWKVNNPIAVFAKDHWKEDWFFENQFLNGFNPVLIEKCNKIPSSFCVTDEMVRMSLRNSTLKQLKQTPGEDNPIFLPSDAELDWMLAKMWVRSCDFQHFKLVSHLLKTYLMAETFSLATLRQLPSLHPIYKLLAPHVKYMMHINNPCEIETERRWWIYLPSKFCFT